MKEILEEALKEALTEAFDYQLTEYFFNSEKYSGVFRIDGGDVRFTLFDEDGEKHFEHKESLENLFSDLMIDIDCYTEGGASDSARQTIEDAKKTIALIRLHSDLLESRVEDAEHQMAIASQTA